MSNDYHIDAEDDMFAEVPTPIEEAVAPEQVPTVTVTTKPKRRVAAVRAIYTDELIARVVEQAAPRVASAPAVLFGVVEAAPPVEVMAKDLLDMLNKTATPARSIDQAFGHADGQLQAWLVGGMTKFTDAQVGVAAAIVYHTKVAKLEHLRGEDRESLIGLIKKMCDTIQATQ